MVHEGPHQALAKEIYTELRQNLITNIFKVHPIPRTLCFPHID